MSASASVLPPSGVDTRVDTNQDQEPSPFSEWLQGSSSLIREFLVEVLGCFIGILFTIAVCALVITSGTCCLRAFYAGTFDEPTFATLLKSNVDAFHAWLLFIIAYVVGGIFQRQDPKRPDRKSLEKVLRDFTDEELQHFEVQTEFARKGSLWWRARQLWLKLLDRIAPRPHGSLGRARAARIAASPDAQFPYAHFKSYLQSRKLEHLVRFAPWNSGENWSGCSKMFINALKIRIQLVAPRKCGEIVRNEAHVRMMSSVWFAARAIFGVLWASMIPVLLAIGRQVWFPAHTGGGVPLVEVLFSHDIVVYAAMASFAAASALWLRWHVESRFHYQRVKEIVYVFETAYCIAKMGRHELLENLPGTNS